jgi:hypothetical protein
MGQQELILKRATRITPSGELKHDDYDVLCDDKVVGRIMKAAAAPVGTPWLWTFAYGAHRDYSTTCGYAVDRDEAMGSRRGHESVREGVAWGVIVR